MQKYYCWKGFWLSKVTRVGSISNLPKSFGETEQKNTIQTQRMKKSLEIRSFYNIFNILSDELRPFQIFPRKFGSIFYKNKILTEN